ncbi:MAG: hypothetical protein R3C42_05845 [Parvularculaceae bacterium]|nr:hypothetical protein [Parvularculaceae bacterium]
MRSAVLISGIIASCLAICAVSPAAPAFAQTQDEAQAVSASRYARAPNRAVGVEGRMKEVYWAAEPDSARLFAKMQMFAEAGRIARAPGALRHTKVWTARADVCSTPGEEILMQIRSPLTCGSLGCEMLVLSDAGGGAPRVIMRTVGDSIDSPVIDGLIINRGSKNQRAWRYDAAGDFRQINRRPQ